MKNLNAVLCGLVGTLLALAVWHLYSDHVLLHQVVDAINRAAQTAPK